jgi:hypothetical protein
VVDVERAIDHSDHGDHGLQPVGGLHLAAEGKLGALFHEEKTGIVVFFLGVYKICDTCFSLDFITVINLLMYHCTVQPNIFELGRQARPGRQTGIRLYLPVPAEGQNKYWGHRLTDKAITYQQRYINNKYASLYA